MCLRKLRALVFQFNFYRLQPVFHYRAHGLAVSNAVCTSSTRKARARSDMAPKRYSTPASSSAQTPADIPATAGHTSAGSFKIFRTDVGTDTLSTVVILTDGTVFELHPERLCTPQPGPPLRCTSSRPTRTFATLLGNGLTLSALPLLGTQPGCGAFGSAHNFRSSPGRALASGHFLPDPLLSWPRAPREGFDRCQNASLYGAGSLPPVSAVPRGWAHAPASAMLATMAAFNSLLRHRHRLLPENKATH